MRRETEYQAVDLPYVGHELSMTVIVPDRGRFAEFEDSLDAALVGRVVAGLESRYITLDLPRFEFESQFRLGETLKSMGMSNAFDRTASDFSGMDGRSCLAGNPECLYIRRWSTRHSFRWTKRAPRRPRPPA